MGSREIAIQLAEKHGVKVEFCWEEYIPMPILEEKDIHHHFKSEADQQFLESLGEEKATNFIDSLKNELREMQKRFEPLKTHNILLVGTKL